jgi:ATP synthase subunit D
MANPETSRVNPEPDRVNPEPGRVNPEAAGLGRACDEDALATRTYGPPGSLWPRRAAALDGSQRIEAASPFKPAEVPVRHAAAQRARLVVSAELAATRTRQRAVEKRWVPKLESELLSIRRQLDEQELEEGLRLRWAAEWSQRSQ